MSGLVPSASVSYTWEADALTHTGYKRQENQDDLLVSAGCGLFVVADGVGGLEHGSLASRTLVETLASVRTAVNLDALEQVFQSSVQEANTRLRSYGRDNALSLGSTVAALLAHGDQYCCAWAGDSRVYLLRDGRLRQLSRDHTEANALVESGVLTEDEARTWPRRHVITRAVGVEDHVDIEVRRGHVRDQDVFLLCTDGLTAHLDDTDIEDLLRRGTVRDACRGLIDLTLQRGATDNVTVVVALAHQARERCVEADQKTVLLVPDRRTDVWDI